ncbi:hypothetical protein [Methanochimaera problematica]|nr:hypothetical protein [Methanoplanus sp. FWC-SCC4]
MKSVKSLKDLKNRQEKIKEVLTTTGTRAPWDLPVRELYTVRAIRLGGL